MKMRVPDKTELFNLLTIIAALILSGGSSLLEIIPEDVPTWAWPILVLVALVVNLASRDQVKSQRDFSERMQSKTGKEQEGQDDSLSASEALYGFMSWLASREKEITISSAHDAAEPAELVSVFCEINNLREPRSGWENRLIQPTRDYADMLDNIEIVGDSSARAELDIGTGPEK